MDRREYLGVVTTSLLAGCANAVRGGAAGEAAAQDPIPSTLELPVSDEELRFVTGRDAIPAIVQPAFGTDWHEVGAELPEDASVIGVERNGAARAYPLRILNWHEVVNDEFAGPLLVSYCPLCGSGVTAIRRVGGSATLFGVSGQLWKSDLVMYDSATGSLWSQIRAQAIRGPRTGERLELVPSAMTSWATWRDEYPDTEVLLPPPASETIGAGSRARDYTQNPYEGYASDIGIGIANRNFADDRLHTKAIVIGVTHDGAARAYPLSRVREIGVVNDVVAGRAVVVTTDPGGSLVAYDRTIDRRQLVFKRVDERHIRAEGSRFRIASGVAVDGPFKQRQLSRANDVSPKFWFAWATFHPETTVFGEN